MAFFRSKCRLNGFGQLFDFPSQQFHILANLRIHDLCINLCCPDALMPQDFRYRFNRYTVLQSYRRRKSMPGNVGGYRFVDAA